MKIGFLVQRIVYYKFFGCLIDEALKRGHTVFCYHDYGQSRTGPKGYQFPYLRQAPRFANGLSQPFSFSSEEDFLNLMAKHRPKALISLNFSPFWLNLRQKTKPLGIKWVALQQGLDSLFWTDLIKETNLALYYSKAWMDFSFDYFEKQNKPFDKKSIEEKVRLIGFPEIDQAKLVNPFEIKKRWGIPENQKVVLFLPFSFGATNDKFWSMFIYGNGLFFLKPLFGLLSFKKSFLKEIMLGQNDKRFCLLLKDFCKRNDVFLLVKSRKKDPVKPYLVKIANKVLYDEREYPATIIECFAVADLCLNFVSTAVLESAALGCPNISIFPSNHYKDIQNPLWKLLLSRYRDIFDFKGVSQLVSLADVFKFLKEKTLADFPLDVKAQAEYCKKYLGSEKPSKKAIDEIEKIV